VRTDAGRDEMQNAWEDAAERETKPRAKSNRSAVTFSECTASERERDRERAIEMVTG